MAVIQFFRRIPKYGFWMALQIFATEQRLKSAGCPQDMIDEYIATQVIGG